LFLRDVVLSQEYMTQQKQLGPAGQCLL